MLRISGPQSGALAQSLGVTAVSRGVVRAWLSVARLEVPACVYVFPAGASYTGEEVVELHLPGSPLLADLVLRELLARGARLAEPGEFTARAFFSGRLDLAEAEGVAAAISAGSQRELQAAQRLFQGELTRRVKPLCDRLAELLALTEAGIDFAEEDIRFITPVELAGSAAALAESLRELLQSSVRFERLSHEPVVVLAGRANAGKSTLLNALCGAERVVVSPIAGTTRDAISAPLDLPRGRVLLVDIAGLDDAAPSAGVIERQMHKQSLHAVMAADVVLWVRECGDHRPPLSLPAVPACEVLTKIDVQPAAEPPRAGGVAVSAQSGAGMPLLRQRLDSLAFGESGSAGALAINARHVTQIETAIADLERVQHSLQAGDELAALELREALDALGQITGIVSPDEVLGRVFSSFCIGK